MLNMMNKRINQPYLVTIPSSRSISNLLQESGSPWFGRGLGLLSRAPVKQPILDLGPDQPIQRGPIRGRLVLRYRRTGHVSDQSIGRRRYPLCGYAK